MSRGDGFPTADVDVRIMDDQKVVALARRLRDRNKTLAAIGLYVAVLTKSWGAGHRLTVEEAAPVWDLEPVDEIKADLQAVGLLDEEGRIPQHAWDSWYGPALDRRLAKQRSGSLGGKRSSERRSSDATAVLKRRSSSAEPDRPTGRPPIRAGRSESPMEDPKAMNGAPEPFPIELDEGRYTFKALSEAEPEVRTGRT